MNVKVRGEPQPGQIGQSLDEIQYDLPLPEGIFEFEIPEGTEVIDQTQLWETLNNPDYGMSAEGMTDQQARVELARRFWDAVLAEDWDAAHHLHPAASKKFLEE